MQDPIDLLPAEASPALTSTSLGTVQTTRNLLATLGGAFLVLVIGFAIYSNNIAVPIEIAEISNNTGSVELSLVGNISNLVKNQATSLDLKVNSPTDKLAAVQVELLYDPAFLSNVTVTQGSHLTVVLAAASVGDNTIKFAYAPPPDSGGVMGEGTIATISFTPIQSGDTNLTFTTNTLAAVTSADGNALRSAEDAIIQVAADVVESANPSATASPTSTPTTTPTATPTSTPTSTPTATPTSTPTPTPYRAPATPTPIPTATPRTTPRVATPAPTQTTRTTPQRSQTLNDVVNNDPNLNDKPIPDLSTDQVATPEKLSFFEWIKEQLRRIFVR